MDQVVRDRAPAVVDVDANGTGIDQAAVMNVIVRNHIPLFSVTAADDPAAPAAPPEPLIPVSMVVYGFSESAARMDSETPLILPTAFLGEFVVTASTPTQVVWGQFTEGLSKKFVRSTQHGNRVSLCCIGCWRVPTTPSLKGSDVTAQGNALGLLQRRAQAPKGRR